MRRILLDFTLTRAAGAGRASANRSRTCDRASSPAWDAAGLLEHRVIDGSKRYFNRAPSNLFRLSARGSRAARAADAVQRRAARDGPSPSPGDSRCGAREPTRPASRPARARHAVAHRRGRRGAGGRDGSRLDSVSACAAGPAGRHPLRRQRARAAHRSRPNRRCSAPSTSSAPRSAGKPTTFSVTYELTIFGQYHPIDPDEGRCPSTPSRELAPYLGERAAAHRVHRRPAQVLARGRRRRDAIRIASRRSCSLAVDRIPWAGALEYSTITQHQRLRAARGPRRLRPADAAADDAAAPQRHSGALAVGHGSSPTATTTTCTTGAGCTSRRTAGCRWT